MSDAVHVFDRLLQIALLIQDDLARSFADSELTVARTHLLWELHRLGPSTQQMLATALKVTPRNVTGLVDALEAASFVTRRPHPSDRRATLVTLTDRGRQTMTEMEQQRSQIATELVADLDPTGLEAFAQGLDSVAARLQALTQAAIGDEGQRSA
ncbi:MAG TPA: MarR family transcriptional regulator [Propionibacteriaceae bacterium]|nr:MarR family transcriptional regulator [Propionibacteriaceae bacterium]